ncbi:MAG TPA: dihydroorotase [Candidatus Blautia stercoripullorum]|uniref:Dihydroorotase n=1 Tax=Candidatus Blautia stercoripullorum TaxID=2838502 RepID=A0A9D2R6B2_9FIRM|nr:dihydroorotase [Candidatus Blautia stercoripullorum]
MKILIKNGRMINPSDKTDETGDLFIEDGVIKEKGPSLDLPVQPDKVIDAQGCYVMPGLIDLHVHLRDPGLTHKEDVASGSRAAARGGFTTILAMPNTKPVIDSPDRVLYVTNKAKELAPVHVLQIGAVTKQQKGEELADIEGMIQAGIPAISEDGKSVMNVKLYKEAMEIAASHNIPVFAHCEDQNLVNGGCVNEDQHSREQGLPGISNAVEDVIAARDIVLAKETGARLHLCHCSTGDSVEMIRLAKEEGIPVTGEVCPHHFTLTSDDMVPGDTNFKMNPPLRTPKDRQALLNGLKNDIIDVISTDHAPHSREEKQQSMQKAPFGIVGLETSVALTITELVDKGVITPMQMAEKMSYNPARIIGSDRGTLDIGKPGDVTVIDPNREYIIDSMTFLSKGKNTPFNGWKVKGLVKATICDGKVVYQSE